MVRSDFNASEQHSFCNLGTTTTAPSPTTLNDSSRLIQGWKQYGLPGLLVRCPLPAAAAGQGSVC